MGTSSFSTTARKEIPIHTRIKAASTLTEAGVKVAHHLPGALPGTTFSEDGRVGLGCLTPGAYTVSLWVDERRWGAEFELDPGPEEVPVTVTLEPTPE